MWKLYRLLEKGIKGTQKEYLIDELSDLLSSIDQENYLLSLSLMYDNKITYKELHPIDSVILFVDGLNLNKFFEFSNFVQGMK